MNEEFEVGDHVSFKPEDEDTHTGRVLVVTATEYAVLVDWSIQHIYWVPKQSVVRP
jgi:hypothetical protein